MRGEREEEEEEKEEDVMCRMADRIMRVQGGRCGLCPLAPH